MAIRTCHFFYRSPDPAAPGGDPFSHPFGSSARRCAGGRSATLGSGAVTIAEFLHEVVSHKEAGHRIGQPDFIPASRSMSCIGG